jgi:tight adherence protein C
VTAALLLGAIFGISMLAAWRWARAPLPLAGVLDRLHTPIAQASSQMSVGWAGRLGWALGGLVGPRGLLFGDQTWADLRIVGRTGEQHAAAKASVAIVGGVLPAGWAGLVALGGIAADVGWVAAVSVLFAAVGFVVPDLLVRAEAAERRRDFTVALGANLDLVVISLAGGAGVESALRNAARLGQGWAFMQLGTALEHASI